MAPTEQDNELRRNICGIATGVLWGKNFNELTLNERSRVNAMAKDLEAYITADRKRVALDKEEMTLRYAIHTLQDTHKEFALENLQRQLDKNLAQQEEL